MPTILSSNPDGTVTVQRDDGSTVDVPAGHPLLQGIGATEPTAPTPAGPGLPEFMQLARPGQTQAGPGIPSPGPAAPGPEQFVQTPANLEPDPTDTPDMAQWKISQRALAGQALTPGGESTWLGDPGRIRVSDVEQFQGRLRGPQQTVGDFLQESGQTLAQRPGPTAGVVFADTQPPPAAPGGPGAPQPFGAPQLSTAELRRAYTQQQEATIEGARVGAQAAAAEAEYRQQVDQQMAGRQAEEAARAQRQQEFLVDQEKRFADLSEEVRSLSVQPDKFWADRGAAAKIGGALAIGLGAAARAFVGGPNNALQIIQSAITRDIDAQKVNIAQARGKLSDAQGLYVRALERFGMENQAEAAARAMYLEDAQNRLRTIAAEHAGPEIQAQAEALNGALEVEKEKELLRWKTTNIQLAQSAAAQRAKAEGAGGLGLPPGVKPDQYIPGIGIAASKMDAQKIKDALEIKARMMPLIQRAREMRQKFGREITPAAFGKTRAAGQTIGTDLSLELKELAKLGVLAGADLELLDAMVPRDVLSPKIATGVVLQQLDELERSVNDKTDAAMQHRLLQREAQPGPEFTLTPR